MNNIINITKNAGSKLIQIAKKKSLKINKNLYNYE